MSIRMRTWPTTAPLRASPKTLQYMGKLAVEMYPRLLRSGMSAIVKSMRSSSNGVDQTAGEREGERTRSYR